MLKTIWRSTALNSRTKIKIFNSNVLSVLLYGSGCWKTSLLTESLPNQIPQTIFWPNNISNEDLLKRTGMTTISEIIQARRWLGHVLRMPPNSLPRWTPQGRRNRGRPKETWRRTALKDLKSRSLSMETAPRVAADRARWKYLVDASST